MIPNFFDVMKYSEANNYIKTENRMNLKYGLPLDEPQLINKLEKVSVPVQEFFGVPWYSISTNITYRNEFGMVGDHHSKEDKDKYCYYC